MMIDWIYVDYLWIIVFLISCLDSHSDGTHSPEDPLLSKFQILQICSDDKNKLIHILD